MKQGDFEKVVNVCSSSVELIKVRMLPPPLRQEEMMSCVHPPPQGQSHTTKMKIKEEFEKLRHYLKTEEANVLTSLKQEEAQKIRVVQIFMEMSRDTFSLSDSMKDVEQLVTMSSFLRVRLILTEA